MKNTILAVVALLACGIARATDLVQVHGSQINPLCTITAARFVGPVTGAITGNASTATSLAGGSANKMPYQSGAGATVFIASATAASVLVGGANTAPSFGAVPDAALSANVPLINGGNSFTGNNNFSIEYDTAASPGAGSLNTITCPSGKYAISGGCSCGTIVAGTSVINRPDGAVAGVMPTGWACQVAGGTGGGCGAFVICGKIKF